MRLKFLIALRYLFSPKRHNAVNVISMISVAGVAVATAAMIVVLSVFNGFSDLAMKQLSRIDPPLAVFPDSGKVILRADSVAGTIARMVPDAGITQVLTEQALASSGDRQMTVRAMGVDPEFLIMSDMAAITIDGATYIDGASPGYAMSSVGVALGLDVRPGDGSSVMLYVPRRVGKISTAMPESSFRSDTMLVAGVWQVEQEAYDSDVLIVDIDMLRQLLDYETEASAIYIYPPNGEIEAVKKSISSVLPAGLTVKNRLEQQAESFRMISIEKWITFLMLAFILVIASFNIISTMSMLIIEKQDNTFTLMAVGGSKSLIRGIYAIEGWLISIGGGIAGLLLGIGLCMLQEHYGLIGLSTSSMTGSLAIDSYPVALQWGDVAMVGAAIFIVGAVTAVVASLRNDS
ncbi:MAG: ABC transporter permease [Muribaculaceae bacterium]|nr:ABC transporter permease [Muribaculaceae bacterium]